MLEPLIGNFETLHCIFTKLSDELSSMGETAEDHATDLYKIKNLQEFIDKDTLGNLLRVSDEQFKLLLQSSIMKFSTKLESLRQLREDS